ncbi:MAG: ABC transporter ATP-binding protein [Phycisphaeraceae bacterium]
MADTFIELDNLTKRFGDNTVLEGLTGEIRRGERLAIIGPSGGGKTTLLNIITGQLAPDEGAVRFRGRALHDMDESELNQYRLKIGVVFQTGALLKSMTLADNVALPLREHTDFAPSTVDLLVRMKLEMVDLRDAADRPAPALSKGMAKRGGLARALALDPDILFFDEPTGGLDPVTAAQVDAMIVDLNEKLGVTTVVVTHDMEAVNRVAQRVALLHEGRFFGLGPLEEMRDAGDETIRQFIRGETHGPLTRERQAGDAYARDLLGKNPRNATSR